jgi:hypothetical protein
MSRKRPSDPSSSGEQSAAKQSKLGDSLGSPVATVDFDPSALVSAKEGTIAVPSPVRVYLEKYLRRCLTKEERGALFKEHPRPDLDVTSVPKVDKYMVDFLGTKFPKDQDTDLSKIQATVLACIRPLTSAWQELLEAEPDNEEPVMVPASQVVAMIQRTLCLLGNASEFISQTRRSKILEVIDKSWGKFGTEKFQATGSLFGEEFQTNLPTKVEKDVALSKAVSILKRNRKGKETAGPSSHREGQSRRQFFRWGPPTKYGGGQGRNQSPYAPQGHKFREQPKGPGKGHPPFHQIRNQRFHEPRLPPMEASAQMHKKKFGDS